MEPWSSQITHMSFGVITYEVRNGSEKRKVTSRLAGKPYRKQFYTDGI